jgi:hypothetical protein
MPNSESGKMVINFYLEERETGLSLSSSDENKNLHKNSLHHTLHEYRGHFDFTFSLSWSGMEPCKIWGLHGGNYEECRLLGYKNPVRTSQETHYVSATEPSQLMLCKIWDVHGGNYEECRLLGYKNPVRTSQETHYVSATEPSRLMLCKIWDVHGGNYEECRLLGYKNPVRTSQETHYFSATEPSRLMLCKNLGFTVWLWRMPSSGI